MAYILDNLSLVLEVLGVVRFFFWIICQLFVKLPNWEFEQKEYA
jgi:hypothetical protein